MQMQLDSTLIGRSSRPVQNEVEKGAIRKFAEAIGDPNPLYRDPEYAVNTRYGKIIAPPTFSMTFDHGEIEGFNIKQDGLIHGKQEFNYERPIFVGDV
ncbi:MAG: FAS1-like dehydratase domain-containing protein, partial [Tumebacillaceae bacterium]